MLSGSHVLWSLAFVSIIERQFSIKQIPFCSTVYLTTKTVNVRHGKWKIWKIGVLGHFNSYGLYGGQLWLHFPVVTSHTTWNYFCPSCICDYMLEESRLNRLNKKFPLKLTIPNYNVNLRLWMITDCHFVK